MEERRRLTLREMFSKEIIDLCRKTLGRTACSVRDCIFQNWQIHLSNPGWRFEGVIGVRKHFRQIIGRESVDAVKSCVAVKMRGEVIQAVTLGLGVGNCS